ncbi:hypothetical protein [Myxococcus sp. NMCA1]|uniref:hypothetical protein n=1 Tax=Myxococcus sp. NMCA1 TaxID=2996785 RepID=UPI0022856792|nr:hypothetical protein [Myxococcus sp. NMCA1]WAM30090.1 hypothetical protein OZ403_18950 [Myxococcus sp. NMCA1]
MESPTSTLEHLGPTLAPVLLDVLENPESSWEELVQVRYVLARRAYSSICTARAGTSPSSA